MKKVILLISIAIVALFGANAQMCSDNQVKFKKANDKILDMERVIEARYKKLNIKDWTFNYCTIKNTDKTALQEQTLQMGKMIESYYPYMLKDFEQCKNRNELDRLIVFKQEDFPIINNKVEELMQELSAMAVDCK